MCAFKGRDGDGRRGYAGTRVHPQWCRGAELQGGCSRNDAEAQDAAGLVVLRQRCCCGTMGVPHRSISPLLPPARTSWQCLVALSPQGWPEEVAAGVSPPALYGGSLVGQAVTQAAASPGDTPGAVGTPRPPAGRWLRSMVLWGWQGGCALSPIPAGTNPGSATPQGQGCKWGKAQEAACGQGGGSACHCPCLSPSPVPIPESTAAPQPP